MLTDFAMDVLKKLVLAALLGGIGWTYAFVRDTDHRLWVLEWRVDQAIGTPSWEQHKP